ncbi:MAG: MFS transporter [Planctomycetes bacterium]|nr:MFS transporter [Planctomycetota bacterium]
MSALDTRLGRSFGFLNVTQFLGAFNDNVFKLLLIMFLTADLDPESVSNVIAIAGIWFVVPFLLFTAFAGTLADCFSKRTIVVFVKVAEILVMLAACIAFAFASRYALYAVLFAMAMQSAFFGPSKYGIVPELVRSNQLSKANGFLEGCTYLAIVGGTAFGLALAEISDGHYAIVTLACLVIAIAGFVTSLFVKKTPVMGSKSKASLFFVRDIYRTLTGIRKDRDLLLAVFASAYFMLLAAFIYNNLIPYGMSVFELNQMRSGRLFVVVAVGIGIGSFIAGKISGRKVEPGLIPMGAIGLTVTSFLLGFIGESKSMAVIMILLMGISAGLFVVPIHAFIQLRSPAEKRGRILAASGFLGWVGVLCASGLIILFTNVFEVTSQQLFIILSVMTLVLTVITVVLLPDFLVRFLVLLLTRICYKIKIKGLENVPEDGGVLLVSNHVSWADAVILSATQQRRIRFVMDKAIYEGHWLRWVFKLMKVIPISPKDSPKKLIASFREARAAMDEGDIVCIFAEGAITRHGMLLAFKGGYQRIIKGTDYSIVPAYIGGAWGSIFSYYRGKLLAGLPKKFPYPVSVHFGKPMPPHSTSSAIRLGVMELSCDYFEQLKRNRRSLGESFISSARKHWRRHCIADSTSKRLRYGQTLTAAFAVSEKLKSLTSEHRCVGILLPPSAGGVLANIAVALLNKISVNLNYTVSPHLRASSIAQCDIKCVISSRAFLEKAKITEEIKGLVFIEDIIKQIGSMDKFSAFLKARFVPKKLLACAKSNCGDEIATIIFSSGSTGNPKGVMLTHHNILSNVECMRLVFRVQTNDDLCAVLPFFHSLGFTCTLWLPITSGVSATYIANPIDAKTVGECVRKNKSTLLFAPPTFLIGYIRRIDREDFASFRQVVAGAEKLKQKLMDSFEKKFGIKLLEGYGATELSPVATLNVPNIEIEGVFQTGAKPGTVGHPLPGVAAKVVDLETGELLDVDQVGLLKIKGPNVMAGYLDMPEMTKKVLRDGWYDTGDVASIDEDGFVTIKDRLSRFSKIGGEMVPHVGIEEAYLKGLATHEHIVAVTGVPDEKKGEELVVLYLQEAGGPEKLHEIITNSDLPNIWKPRRSNYIKIDKMPVLGSGKLDIMKLRKMAFAQMGIEE